MSRQTIADDSTYFDRILTRLELISSQRIGANAGPFLNRVRDRIDHGASVYGPRAFLRQDRGNLAEASDEAADLVAYPLFELRRLDLAGQHADGVRALLYEAMFLAVSAQQRLAQAQHLLDRA